MLAPVARGGHLQLPPRQISNEDGSIDAPADSPAQTFACAPTPTAGHQEIDCPEGVHMDVEVSPACAEGGCGIIFDVHGFTMTGDQLDEHTRMRLLAPPLRNT